MKISLHLVATWSRFTVVQSLSEQICYHLLDHVKVSCVEPDCADDSLDRSSLGLLGRLVALLVLSAKVGGDTLRFCDHGKSLVRNHSLYLVVRGSWNRQHDALHKLPV